MIGDVALHAVPRVLPGGETLSGFDHLVVAGNCESKCLHVCSVAWVYSRLPEALTSGNVIVPIVVR